MLSKLMKYDLQFLFRYLSIFYAIGLIAALLTRWLFTLESSPLVEFLSQFATGVTVSVMVSSILNNVLRFWVRFAGQLYGDESYLTHTLPVKKSTHYLAKALAGGISLLTTFGVIGILLFVAYYSPENLQLVKNLLFGISQALDSSMVTLLGVVLVVLFLEFFCLLECGFTGIILGHKKSNNKKGWSVAFGGVAYMLAQLLVVVSMGVVSLFSQSFADLFTAGTVLTVATVKQAVVLAIGVYSLLAVVIGAVNQKLLNQGVNVE